VQIRNYAGKDEKRTGDGKDPSGDASTTPEEKANAEKHGQQSNAESIFTTEIPVRAHHRDLIDQQVSANADHDETQCKMADTAGCSTGIAEGTVFNGGKYSRERKQAQVGAATCRIPDSSYWILRSSRTRNLRSM